MNKLQLIGLITLVLFSACKKKNILETKEISIIPLPKSTELLEGNFVLDNKTALKFEGQNKEIEAIAAYFSDYLNTYYQLNLTPQNSEEKSTISMALNPDIQGDEAYELSIDSKGITIMGKTAAGIFYGIQSFIQMLPPKMGKADGFKLPFCKITDEPSFQWRGVHLDVCRHFFPVDFVKKVIDMAAHLKLNTFHWHLTEDQGWRIEIKKYPKLTEIGSWRKETLIGKMLDYPEKYDGKRYGGYYTQEQIKDVVAYAQQRQITIVPEIEMPGHAVAALTAYPEYSCTGGPFEVRTTWGISEDVFCAGKEETFAFLEDILAEVIDLFPGKYIHIGGDECPKKRWENCPDCQRRIKTEKLKNEHELQSYFIKRIEKFLSSKGKKLIGWDEILEGGLAEGAAVMSWRGEDGGIAAAMDGHFVVMSPNASNYFDHYQGKYNEPLAIGGYTPLRQVYDYQPVPKALDSIHHPYILGSQANLWTEYIPTESQAEYMLFPRLIALAENLWTPEKKQNWESFIIRMGHFYPYLDQWEINYRINPPEGYEDINKILEDTISIVLKNEIPSSRIRYTIDGSEPDSDSKLYEGPLQLKLDTTLTLKSITIMPSGKESAVMTGVFEKMVLLEPVQKKNYGPGVAYMYYEGEFTSAKKLSGLEIYNGVVNNFKLPGDHSEKFFGVAYTGYLKVPVGGVYNFILTSSDGSVLYIHDKLVVDNDFFQWPSAKSGKIALKEGLHPFKLNYFQAKYSSFLDVKVEGPEMESQKIPDNWLWH